MFWQFTLSKVQFRTFQSPKNNYSLSTACKPGPVTASAVFAGALLLSSATHAQTSRRLSLPEALQIAVANNRDIRHAKIEKEITGADIDEKKELRLPEVDFHASYARITDLTEYRHGLGDKLVTHTIPVIADLTGSAKMPLYTGGKIRYAIQKARQQDEIASLAVLKTENDVKMEATELFFHAFKMLELDKLLQEHIREEEDRLAEVRSFKAHGTVTRNEVLRAELQLSDMRLSLTTNRSHIEIALHDLHTLLEMPEEVVLELDTARLLDGAVPVEDLHSYLRATLLKDEIRISEKKEAVLETEQRITRAGYLPNIHLFASYGFNYPNYMFFPPDPYLYTLGRVGVEATYSLSNLYKNKTRTHLARLRTEAQHAQTAVVKNKVTDNVFKHHTELQDLRETIPVKEKAVTQATENYRIVKLKYLHQLALITEMLDADNALLQARFDLLTARINATVQHRRLLYASGQLP
jgi:outer membrane protein TolC